MRLRLLYFALALSATTYGARITLAPAPDGLSADLIIEGLAGRQVGAYEIRLDYDPRLVVVTGAQGLGFLGVPGVETLRQVQISLLRPFRERVQVSEISLLPSSDLVTLQPDTFGLVRLALEGPGVSIPSFAPFGVVSDAAGNPISIAFDIPEPGTFDLFAIAGLLLIWRARRPARQ